jgi:hypothetical protein
MNKFLKIILTTLILLAIILFLGWVYFYKVWVPKNSNNVKVGFETVKLTADIIVLGQVESLRSADNQYVIVSLKPEQVFKGLPTSGLIDFRTRGVIDKANPSQTNLNMGVGRFKVGDKVLVILNKEAGGEFVLSANTANRFDIEQSHQYGIIAVGTNPESSLGNNYYKFDSNYIEVMKKSQNKQLKLEDLLREFGYSLN